MWSMKQWLWLQNLPLVLLECDGSWTFSVIEVYISYLYIFVCWPSFKGVSGMTWSPRSRSGRQQEVAASQQCGWGPCEIPTENLIHLWRAATSCFPQSLGAARLGQCFFWMGADCTTKDAGSVRTTRCLFPSTLLPETESGKRLEAAVDWPPLPLFVNSSFAASSLISSAFRRCIFISQLDMFTRVCPLFTTHHIPLWACSSFIRLSRSLHLGYRCRQIMKPTTVWRC